MRKTKYQMSFFSLFKQSGTEHHWNICKFCIYNDHSLPQIPHPETPKNWNPTLSGDRCPNSSTFTVYSLTTQLMSISYELNPLIESGQMSFFAFSHDLCPLFYSLVLYPPKPTEAQNLNFPNRVKLAIRLLFSQTKTNQAYLSVFKTG